MADKIVISKCEKITLWLNWRKILTKDDAKYFKTIVSRYNIKKKKNSLKC